MPPRKKSTPAARKAPVKHFTFQLSLNGVAGIALAASCLFLCMFLIGIWAGKTIISPCPSAPLAVYECAEEREQRASTQATYLESVAPVPEDATTPTICVQPRERKKRISSLESPLLQDP